ncbi:MAG: type II toxin-antitoxin system RelE/ParE family toxin [Clostridiales Family XIII bacterium]|jgi:plasmid stabilization system protein ParE|nr:type II toxin-antitoxin system RelE/ParE family toxin [Clostridiales Family XIII bacterium]
MKILWTDEARFQISAIRDYIAKDSVKNANLFVKRLLSAPNRLIRHPDSGRIIPELKNPGKREIILGHYRIMYFVENDTIFITQVRHDARLFDR